MDWQFALIFMMGSLFFLFVIGFPVAFGFIVINIINVILFWGGIEQIPRLIGSMFTSVSSFSLLPIPLFIFMGDILFKTDISGLFLDTINKWIGRVPGRLSIITIMGGTVSGALTGVSMGSIALMGRIMLPEMKKNNYKDPMSLGPIVCTGALALMIPPSVFGVVFGGLARISIGKILIAILLPGLLLAFFYFVYIIVRCLIQKDLAPNYKVPEISLRAKLYATIRDIVPICVIVFCVTGVIFLGIATPSEAAATGALGCVIVAILYKRFTRGVLVSALKNTTQTSVMIFMIIMGAAAFSQSLSISGATRGMINYIAGLPVSPTGVFAIMIVLIMILGLFMDALALMMVTVPVFAPIATALNLDPIWFAVVTLLALSIGPITPPFGLDMFALKAVAPTEVTMVRIYKSTIPFVVIDLIVLVLLFCFPGFSLFLSGFMSY